MHMNKNVGNAITDDNDKTLLYAVSRYSKIIIMDTVQTIRGMHPSQMTTSRLQTAPVANRSVVMGRL